MVEKRQVQYWGVFESPVRQGIFLLKLTSSADFLLVSVCAMACIDISRAIHEVAFICLCEVIWSGPFCLKRGHAQRATFASWKLTTNSSTSQDVPCWKNKTKAGDIFSGVFRCSCKIDPKQGVCLLHVFLRDKSSRYWENRVLQIVVRKVFILWDKGIPCWPHSGGCGQKMESYHKNNRPGPHL